MTSTKEWDIRSITWGILDTVREILCTNGKSHIRAFSRKPLTQTISLQSFSRFNMLRTVFFRRGVGCIMQWPLVIAWPWLRIARCWRIMLRNTASQESHRAVQTMLVCVTEHECLFDINTLLYHRTLTNKSSDPGSPARVVPEAIDKAWITSRSSRFCFRAT